MAMKLEKLDDQQVQGIVSDAIRNAKSFITDEISPVRIKCSRYFEGEVDIGQEAGRSSIVKTVVRDTVRAVKPSLMRIFLSHSKAVEFLPREENDIESSQQATEFLNYKFQHLGGYNLLRDAIHEALIKKVGILRVYYKEEPKTEIHTYDYLDDTTFAVLTSDPEVEIIEHEEVYEKQTMEDGIETESLHHNCKISRTKKSGDLVVDAVPSEEFFIDRMAKSLTEGEFYVCGHSTEVTVSDLLDMGYDYDDVSDLSSEDSRDSTNDAEVFERRRYSVTHDKDRNHTDPSSKKVLLTQAFMKMDIEGSGKAMLYSFILGGDSYKLLEPPMLCDEVPYVGLSIDPEPHTFFGRSLADIVMAEQDSATQIYREILNNLSMSNLPRMAVTDSVNLDDLMNLELGGIVRTRTAPSQSIQNLAVPFTASQSLGVMEYVDRIVEDKTGITKASMGLDPDSLQSVTKAGVQATLQAQQGQIEVMARNLAEGLKELFGKMLRCYTKHQDAPTVMRLKGNFVPIDPKVWQSASMDSVVNVGLGTGRHDERLGGLQMMLQIQQQIMQAYGTQNGLVSLTNIRQTLADILDGFGLRNTDRYVQPMNPEIETQLAQINAQKTQQAQMMQAQNDPSQVLLKAESMKAQTKAQTDMMKAQLMKEKQDLQDDLDRDKLDQELLLRSAEILGKYGTAVDVAQIQAEKNKARQ
tara:strand:- start:1888 stop:3972 length:2085 start_codon:yes stop_codon:yes gene_type:complete